VTNLQLINATTTLSLTSAAQLHGAYDGVGYVLSSGDVDMYSYRTTAATLLNDNSLELSLGGSSDACTAVYLNMTTSELSTSSGVTVGASDYLDTKVATLPNSLFDYLIKGTYQTMEASSSRLDQIASNELTGTLLLRSKVTLVEVSQQDEDNSLLIQNIEMGDDPKIEVTLKATYGYNVSFGAFDRSFICGTDGEVIDMNCPYTSESHTCDWTTFGEGGKYFFEYTCPYVEPQCLYWNEGTNELEGDDCMVKAGYTSDAVTCQCSRLGMFVLSANVTEPKFEALTTPAPTQEPTPLPTQNPTHAPTSSPTMYPTSWPTQQPTRSPTFKPSPFPSPLPTSEPVFAPTLMPSPAPTQRPTSAPNKPSFSPTPFPTLSDTTSTTVLFSITASGPPSDADKDAMKLAVANATGLDVDAVKNLEIAYTSSSSRRLLMEEEAANHQTRSLSVYSWSVSFQVVASLSSLSSVSTPSEFVNLVSTSLSDNAFSNALKNQLPTSVTVVGTVSSFITTRAPTSIPIPAPTSVPIPAPTTVNMGDNGGSSGGDGSMLVIILVCIFGGFLFVGAVVYGCTMNSNAQKVLPGSSGEESFSSPSRVETTTTAPLGEKTVEAML
jgi:hypothetical protein